MGSILGTIMLFFLPSYYSFIGGEPTEACWSYGVVCIYEKVKQEHEKELYAKYKQQHPENENKSNEDIYVPPLH